MQRTFLWILFVAFGFACSQSDSAQIKVENVWSWPVEIMLDDQGNSHGTGVVYLTLVNEGGAADRLLSARSDVAEVVEIHETRKQGDRMMMLPVQDGVQVAPKSSIDFKPGGIHMMLIGLKRSLNPDERFEVVLEFEKSGTVKVVSEVRRP